MSIVKKICEFIKKKNIVKEICEFIKKYENGIKIWSYCALGISIFFLIGSFVGVDESTSDTLPTIYGISIFFAVIFIVLWLMIVLAREWQKVEARNREYKVATEFEFQKLDDGNWKITKYIGFDEENIEIPSRIEDKKIVTVGESLFENNTTIKHVKIGDGIQVIENNAFAGCELVETISLPNTINKIGDFAFKKTAITEIIFPSSIAEMGKGVCYDCCNLEKATFPEGLSEIFDEAFYHCAKLENINIPQSIKRIGKRAFEGCRIYNSLNFHEGLEVIAESAFELKPQSDYKGRIKILLPKSLKLIEKDAFRNCDISEVKFKSGCAAKLEDGAFYGIGCISNDQFISLCIPSSITDIKRIFHTEYYSTNSVRNEYGSVVRDAKGDVVYSTVHQSYDHIPQYLTIYCESGSAAMVFARENKIKCGNYEDGLKI